MFLVDRKCKPERSFTRTNRNRILDVKVFSGDFETDNPEFHETHRISASVFDVCKHLDSRFHMIKVDLIVTLNTLFTRLYRDVTNTVKSLGLRHQCCMCVLRISGEKWKFPWHFDAGHQVVLHLQGVKKWFWKSNENSPVSVITASAGDIVMIPAGVWHATENITSSVCVNYGWKAEESDTLMLQFQHKYPLRQSILDTIGDVQY